MTATPTADRRSLRQALMPAMPDFCPACHAVDAPFSTVRRRIEQEFRGETFRVNTPALRCRHCGFKVAAPGYLDTLRLATHDAYRRKHGLLTGREIAARRKAMGLSQKRFAAYLGVGSASIERWESGTLVQDKASDLLVRERTDHTRFLCAPADQGNERRSVCIAPPQAVTGLSARPLAKTAKTASFRFPDAPAPRNPYPDPLHALTAAA